MSLCLLFCPQFRSMLVIQLTHAYDRWLGLLALVYVTNLRRRVAASALSACWLTATLVSAVAGVSFAPLAVLFLVGLSLDDPSTREPRVWPTARAFQRFELNVEARLRGSRYVTLWSPLLTEALNGAAHGLLVAGRVNIKGGTWSWTAGTFFASTLLWWLLVGAARLYFRRKKLLGLGVKPSC